MILTAYFFDSHLASELAAACRTFTGRFRSLPSAGFSVHLGEPAREGEIRSWV